MFHRLEPHVLEPDCNRFRCPLGGAERDEDVVGEQLVVGPSAHWIPLPVPLGPHLADEVEDVLDLYRVEFEVHRVRLVRSPGRADRVRHDDRPVPCVLDRPGSREMPLLDRPVEHERHHVPNLVRGRHRLLPCDVHKQPISTVGSDFGDGDGPSARDDMRAHNRGVAIDGLLAALAQHPRIIVVVRRLQPRRRQLSDGHELCSSRQDSTDGDISRFLQRGQSLSLGRSAAAGTTLLPVAVIDPRSRDDQAVRLNGVGHLAKFAERALRPSHQSPALSVGATIRPAMNASTSSSR